MHPRLFTKFIEAFVRKPVGDSGTDKNVIVRVSVEQLLRYVVLSPRGSGYYLLLGVVVGDEVAAVSGVTFQVSIRVFQASPSRTRIELK